MGGHSHVRGGRQQGQQRDNYKRRDWTKPSNKKPWEKGRKSVPFRPRGSGTRPLRNSTHSQPTLNANLLKLGPRPEFQKKHLSTSTEPGPSSFPNLSANVKFKNPSKLKTFKQAQEYRNQLDEEAERIRKSDKEEKANAIAARNVWKEKRLERQRAFRSTAKGQPILGLQIQSMLAQFEEEAKGQSGKE